VNNGTASALLANEPTIRFAAFAGVLLAMLAWEALAPRRTPAAPTALRRANNLALVAVDTLLLRLLFPVLAVGLAVQMEGGGLLALVGLPRWLAVVVAVVAFDGAIYWQHRLFHAVPLLWRLHRVHHADPDFDVTTALRFHPGEIVLSMLFKLLLVLALGPPAEAVMIFEVLLNASAMFNHGNVRLPAAVDALLRRLIVTPDMHRVHHSVHADEMQRNFGFCLALWDRWFGTMASQPRDGHAAMRIGVPGLSARPRDLWLDRLLLMPAQGTPAPLQEQGPTKRT
jgi:sterol desaturase/sphingolipid hydroxylase (fatty acid hydroxylase superfamily)